MGIISHDLVNSTEHRIDNHDHLIGRMTGPKSFRRAVKKMIVILVKGSRIMWKVQVEARWDQRSGVSELLGLDARIDRTRLRQLHIRVVMRRQVWKITSN